MIFTRHVKRFKAAAVRVCWPVFAGLLLAWPTISTATADEPVSLDELKRRHREDWVVLGKEIPLFKAGKYGPAYERLIRENATFTEHVTQLLARKNAGTARQQALSGRLQVVKRQDDIFRRESEWLATHAARRMRRIEKYQQVFKHPVLDEAAILYVGTPLCQRPQRYRLPAGAMLANLSSTTPGFAGGDDNRRGAVIKYARLIANPIDKPQDVAFVVLRRVPPNAADRGVLRVVDTAEAGRFTIVQQFDDQQLSLYEWELRTVLRAKPGDCFAMVFTTPVTVAADFVGGGRFGMIRLPEGAPPKPGREFAYADFTILNQATDSALDEAAIGSMGFRGWTSAD